MATDGGERSQIRTPDGVSDGYGWHRHELKWDGNTYEANGNGGQFVIVVPYLDLTVVFTAGNYGQYPICKFRDELVPRYMIGAITRLK